jgi:hypothetical protein
MFGHNGGIENLPALRPDCCRDAVFYVLPITDGRTARMKLSAVGCLGALLAASVVVPRLMH